MHQKWMKYPQTQRPSKHPQWIESIKNIPQWIRSSQGNSPVSLDHQPNLQ